MGKVAAQTPLGLSSDDLETLRIDAQQSIARYRTARSRRKRCDECGKDWADPPSSLCPGCQAYRDHTGHF